MRILYVTNYQGPSVVAQRGHRRNRILGPSRKIELLAKGLVERGHVVDVLSPATVNDLSLRWYPGFEAREPGLGGAQARYLGGLDVPRLNLLVASRQLSRFFEGAPACDVVFLYNLEWYFLAPAAAFARRVRAPLVVEYEDDAVSRISARLGSWHVRRGQRAIDLARRQVAGVVAVSPELARQLGGGNSIVLPGLVGDDLLRIPRSTGPHRGDRLRLVYAGGITPAKGPDLLVKAVSLLDFPVEVDIVGAGHQLEALRRQAEGCDAAVRIHGEVSREALAGHLARADVAVNPHRLTEDQFGQIFPFKVVEYIGAGLPVVTSRFGEFPLPAKDSLVTYEGNSPEALAAALRDAWTHLDALRAGARKARAWVAAEYSTAAAAEKLEGVFQAALDAGKRQRDPACAS